MPNAIMAAIWVTCRAKKPNKTMRKYYIIGEASLDFDLHSDMSADATPGGLFLKTACHLARTGHEVIYLSELGLDPIGRLIKATLDDAGVDTSLCDHFDGGQSPLRVIIGNRVRRYDNWPAQEGFDIIWPRIEDDDVILFGGYYALDPRIRRPLQSFLSYAFETKATLVYIPAVDDMRIARVTKVMPQVYENLELTNLLVTLPQDLPILFSTDNPEDAFIRNVEYYCSSMVAISGTPADSTAISFGTAPRLSVTSASAVQLLEKILIQA